MYQLPPVLECHMANKAKFTKYPSSSNEVAVCKISHNASIFSLTIHQRNGMDNNGLSNCDTIRMKHIF